MTDREIMQQALEALTTYDGTNGEGKRKRVLATLRDRLAQPNDFNPDWDAMAVMVEEQQRMAKRIAELEAQPEQEPVAHTTGHCENHKQKGGCQLHNLQCGWPDCDRKPISTPRQMQPCAGRNCGSTNPSLHSAECFEDYEKSTGMAQPVAPKCGAIIEVFGKDWRLEYMSLPVGKHKLYTQQYNYTAPAKRTPLTDEEIRRIELAVQGYTRQPFDVTAFARAIEAAHGIGEKPDAA